MCFWKKRTKQKLHYATGQTKKHAIKIQTIFFEINKCQGLNYQHELEPGEPRISLLAALGFDTSEKLATTNVRGSQRSFDLIASLTATVVADTCIQLHIGSSVTK